MVASKIKIFASSENKNGLNVFRLTATKKPVFPSYKLKIKHGVCFPATS